MNLNRMAFSATLHCLAGCAVGEVLGMVIGMAFGLGTVVTIILAVTLAFVFGFAFSTVPLLRRGMGFFAALSIVFAADTLSIATMEVVDNLVMVLMPGAMDVGLANPYFWFSLALSLVAAFIVAYPVNRYLMTKGKGHALIHKSHHD